MTAQDVKEEVRRAAFPGYEHFELIDMAIDDVFEKGVLKLEELAQITSLLGAGMLAFIAAAGGMQVAQLKQACMEQVTADDFGRWVIVALQEVEQKNAAYEHDTGTETT